MIVRDKKTRSDVFSGIDRDDLLDTKNTDANGAFELAGTEDEFTSIDPIVSIYTDCDDVAPCQRMISFEIPDAYIASGKTANKVFDLGETRASRALGRIVGL